MMREILPSFWPGLGIMIGITSLKCVSSASRAMMRCMTSDDPSKMRPMRMSRSVISRPQGRSPRSYSDSAVS